ncbi:carbonic anhydrase [Candidatus Neomarinimicrobiota bacterium]
MQSPIHIERTDGAGEEDLQFHYLSAPLHIVNTGHTVQVNLKPGSYLMVDNTRFDLLQFHFHVPSEHLILNQTFAMEAHLVHQNSTGDYAMIGILYNCGEVNPIIKTLWEHLPRNPGEEQTPVDVIIDPLQLIPPESRYYAYTGSLTTAPFAEGVKWILFQPPQPASTAQLEQFTALFGKNARPVQPLLGRKVLEGAS